MFEVGAITMAKLSSAVIAMIAAIIASRILSVSDFGALSFILSASVVVGAIIDWGATIFVRKRTTFFRQSHDRRVGERLGGISLGLVLRFSTILVGFLVAAVIAGSDAFPFIYVAVVPIGLAFCAELMCGELLRIRTRYVWAEYYGGGLRQSVYLFILGLTLVLGGGLNWIVVGYCIAIMVAGLTSLILIGGLRLPRIANLKRKSVGGVDGQRRAFVLISLLNILLNQMPILIAGVFSSEADAGIVRVAMLFGLLMQMAISANAMLYAPKISAAARGDSFQLATLVRQSSRLGLIGIPAGIVGILLTPWLISFMFGAQYEQSVGSAQFLVGLYGVLSVFGAYGQFVLLRGGEGVSQGAAVAAVVSQLIMIPMLVGFFSADGYVIAYGFSILISYCYLGVFGQLKTGISPGPV